MTENQNGRRGVMASAKRIVIKVGTSTITFDSGRMNLRNIDRLARAISNLMNSGKQVILVTSGAIGVGVGCLDMEKKPTEMRDKQAVAAVTGRQYGLGPYRAPKVTAQADPLDELIQSLPKADGFTIE